MDIISFNEASTANERIQRVNANPDSDSGIVTVPKTIAAGETVTVPAGRVAVLPNVVVDGTLVVDGEVFVPSGGKLTEETKSFFTAAEGQTTFVTDYPIGFVDVYVNGIRLFNTDYTAINGTSVVLNEALNAGDSVEIVAFGTFEVANTYTKGEADSVFVKNTGNETIADVKTFTSSPIVPTPVNNGDAVNKEYVDSVVNVGSNNVTAVNEWKYPDLVTEYVATNDLHVTNDIIATGLPASDPLIEGMLWNSAGTLKISAGA